MCPILFKSQTITKKAAMHHEAAHIMENHKSDTVGVAAQHARAAHGHDLYAEQASKPHAEHHAAG
jgi:hypothetical protein